MNPNVRVSVETISPSVASVMLANNGINRRLRQSRVEQYANMMSKGQWQLTGEAICISDSGYLLNGQHRLSAVVLSGLPITTVVVRGVDSKTFAVMDSGLNRTAGDALAQVGYKDTHLAAATVRLFLGIQAGLNPVNTQAMALVTREDILNWCSDTKNAATLNSALVASRRLYEAVGGVRTAWAALFLLGCEHYHPIFIQKFADTLISGASLGAGDPRLALRSWTARNKGSKKFSTATQLGTYIKSFNAWVKGDSQSVIRPWDSDKSSLPKIDPTIAPAASRFMGSNP